MKRLGIYGDAHLTELLMKEFMTGWMGNISNEDQDRISTIENTYETTFAGYVRQESEDLFIHMRFQKKELSWRDVDNWNLGPSTYPTEKGWCLSLIHI